ncbi:hypothetical protein, partial [Aureivirga sp. CE67]|uniref:hypothetical protein n=1 Tax=Aureivirga sp. CE67 TaxID=1788983 RepID=UPI001E31D155
LSIPNREVKPTSADGTAFGGRVCHRLSLNPDSFFESGFFLLKTFLLGKFIVLYTMLVYVVPLGLFCFDFENS